jgi:nitrate/nitrite-specific signal transduction histidine kinase
MGLRIMAHRARMIGAGFQVARREAGGTGIVCRLPVALEDRLAS